MLVWLQDCVVCDTTSLEELLAYPLTCPTDSPPTVEEDIYIQCDFAAGTTARDVTLLTTAPIDILKPGSNGTTIINCVAVNANRGNQSNLVVSLTPGATAPQGCYWNPAAYLFTISVVGSRAATIKRGRVFALPVESSSVVQEVAAGAEMSVSNPHVHLYPPPPPPPPAPDTLGVLP